MANKNPSPETRFKAGDPQPAGAGRPKGQRDRLTSAFVYALAEDFDANGVVAIKTVREKDPATYLRVIAAIVPKEIEISRPLDGVSDDELAAAIDYIRAKLPKTKPEQRTVN